MDDWVHRSASELARSIGSGEISSLDAVDACLARIEQVNPTLNAVGAVCAEAARAEARGADAARLRGARRGPLHGVPITLKDSLDTAGVVSTWGTPGRARHVPERDATAVARLRAAGAILLGKTNTPELTMSFQTENRVYGRTHNPFDPERSAGGSSGGAAAIVCSGGSPLDLGSDTGGSIRLPSHFCGCAGLRPTSGRVPRTGHAIPAGGLIDSLTTIGPIARRVEDLELALRLIAGPDGRDPFVAPVPLRDPREVRVTGLRLAFHTHNGIRAPTPPVHEAVTQAAKVLAEEGCAVEEACPEGIEETGDLFLDVLTADGGAMLQRILEQAGTDPATSTLHAFLGGPGLAGPQLARLIERWDAFRVRMLGFLDAYDAILCPVAAIAAPRHEEMSQDLSAFTYTMTYNLTGWPAAVVRVGTSPEGLPIGVQLVARPWREDVALALARRLEERLGGWQPPPL